VLDLAIQNAAMYEVSATEKAPYLDIAGTVQAEMELLSLFVLNRDLVKPRQLS